jgi:signal transduction histidine kinase/ligand-binding sensor domain-containing protein
VLAMLLFLLMHTHAWSQQYFQHFNHITTQNGLVTNTVNDVVQDQQGYVWIATPSALQVYDGVDYATITSQNTSLPFAAVNRVFCDEQGALWLITAQGVYTRPSATGKFSPVTFGHDGNVEAMRFYEDTNHTLWVTSRQGGLFFLDRARNVFESHEKKWPALNGTVTRIAQERRSGIYWLISGNALHTVDPNGQHDRTVDPFAALRGNSTDGKIDIIHAIHVDRNDNLWISFRAGNKNYTCRLKSGETQWNEITGAESSPVHSFITSRDGTTWGIGRNVYRNRNNRWETVTGFEEVPYEWQDATDHIQCLTEDRDGALWVGTNNGLFVFLPQAHNFIYSSSRLLDQYPVGGGANYPSLTVVRDSLLLVTDGTQPPSLLSPAFTRAQTLDPIFSTTSARPSTAYYDDSNVVWAGGDGKLIRYDLAHTAVREIPIQALKETTITCVTGSADHQLLWLAAENGAIGSWSKQDQQYKVLAQLSDVKDFKKSRVHHILPEEDFNRMWVITERQVIRIALDSQASVKIFVPEKEALIRQAAEFDPETILLATDKGLYVFNKASGQAELLQAGPDIFRYDVTGVLVDHLHQVWVSTRGNGLFRISSSLREVKKFGADEGVVYANFLPAVNARLANNTLVIATTHGFLAFDPSETPAPVFNPRIRMVSFLVNDTEVIDSLKNEKALALGWNENNVSFQFSSMSFVYRDQTQFSYKLEGQDQRWKPAAQGEKIKYTNLPPGTYKFLVRCKALSGEVVTDEMSVPFTIATPFWKTWVFRLAVAVSLMAVVFLVVWGRYRRQQRILGIKNKIARDLHDHIGSSLSSINIMVSVVQTGLTRKPEQSTLLLEKISKTAHLTQENLHDIVWSIQSGNNSMRHIVGRMKEFMVSIFEGRDVRIDFEVPEEFGQVKIPLEKRYDLYLVFKEIVNNGAKYAEATVVTFRLQWQRNMVTLLYEDDGIGFDMDNASSGNGLHNMRQRGRALGGELVITSAPGKGTRITLAFPV